MRGNLGAVGGTGEGPVSGKLYLQVELIGSLFFYCQSSCFFFTDTIDPEESGVVILLIDIETVPFVLGRISVADTKYQTGSRTIIDGQIRFVCKGCASGEEKIRRCKGVAYLHVAAPVSIGNLLPGAVCRLPARKVGHKVQRLIRSGQRSAVEGDIAAEGEQANITACKRNGLIFQNGIAIEIRGEMSVSAVFNFNGILRSVQLFLGQISALLIDKAIVDMENPGIFLSITVPAFIDIGAIPVGTGFVRILHPEDNTSGFPCIDGKTCLISKSTIRFYPHIADRKCII